VRQVQIVVPAERAGAVLQRARELGACAPVGVRVEPAGSDASPGSSRSLLIAQLPNDRLGELITSVRELAEDAEIAVLAGGALPLRSPLEDVGEQVRDVSRLSTFEVVLGSLQSVGSWTGMLVYSALAGVIGAYGLVFDASYLLVAAMLINPMAAPALVSVIGVAVGDPRMVARGGLRFLVSLLVQAGAALAFGVAYGLRDATAVMEQVTSLSAWVPLLALASGAAGALTQVKSERDSLVSGTAAGFMVAAALAPPAAVLGLSVPLERWDYASRMALLLALQYVAIVAGGAIALAARGVRAGDPATARVSRMRGGVLIALAVVAALALALVPRAGDPSLRLADLSRRAREHAAVAVSRVEGAELVEVRARFARPEADAGARHGLLVEVVVEAVEGAPTLEALEHEVGDAVRTSVADALPGVRPLVDVTVIPGTGRPSATHASDDAQRGRG
jgi:uncharacterized hydrophobic protein (TIGR00271 family)